MWPMELHGQGGHAWVQKWAWGGGGWKFVELWCDALRVHSCHAEYMVHLSIVHGLVQLHILKDLPLLFNLISTNFFLKTSLAEMPYHHDSPVVLFPLCLLKWWFNFAPSQLTISNLSGICTRCSLRQNWECKW